MDYWRKNKMKKLHLGCGYHFLDGWINTDKIYGKSQNDQAGHSIALSGNGLKLLVGAPYTTMHDDVGDKAHRGTLTVYAAQGMSEETNNLLIKICPDSFILSSRILPDLSEDTVLVSEMINTVIFKLLNGWDSLFILQNIIRINKFVNL